MIGVILALVVMVNVVVIAVPKPTYAGFSQTIADIPRVITDRLDAIYDKIGAIMFKNATRILVQQLARQTATNLASSAAGREPVYYKGDIGDIMTSAADAAAGDFLESLVSERVCYYTQEGVEGHADSCLEECSYKYPDEEDADDYDWCADGCDDEFNTDDVENDGVHPKDGQPCSSDKDCTGGGQCLGGFGFSLCDADPIIKTKIQLNIRTNLLGGKPLRAKCTATEIFCNFYQGGRGEDEVCNAYGTSHTFVVGELAKYFDEESNPQSIWLKLARETTVTSIKAADADGKSYAAGNGFKNLKSLISGDLKTLGTVFKDTQSFVLEKTITPDLSYTGQLAADSIGVFTSTFVSKYLEYYAFDKGLTPGRLKGPLFGTIYDSFSSARTGNRGPDAFFADLSKPKLIGGGEVDIVSQLVSCPGGALNGPNNCVITQNFQSAITQKLTIQEAIDSSYLDPNLPFGYRSGETINYTEGYPYRSLLILRRHRILPIGAEIAAQYVKDFGGDVVTLQEVLNGFEDSASPFYGLLSPNWVLRTHDAICQRQGYSDQVVFQEYIDNDGLQETPKEQLVKRQEQCVDERTCISQSADGQCNAYGYCTQEESIWNFEADACDAQFESCQTYELDGKEASYLKNSIDSGACNSANAGCWAYCQTPELDGGGSPTGNWTCNANEAVYFDRDLKGCGAEDEGCSEIFRTNNGANILSNSNFNDFTGTVNEPTNKPGGWDGSGLINDNDYYIADTTVTEPFSGSTSMILAQNTTDDAKAVEHVIDTGYDLGHRLFGVSFYAKSVSGSCTGTQVRVTGGVGATHIEETFNPASDWQLLTFQGEQAFPAVVDANDLRVNVTLDRGCTLAIDAMKVEEGATQTEYNDYGRTNTLNMKLPPDYLRDECSGDLASQPIECNNYAQLCEEEDVGCTLYSPQSDDIDVPGIAFIENHCSEEYAGCKFHQEMPSPQVQPNGVLQAVSERTGNPAVSFISDNAENCSAGYNGCEEFTNINKQEEGGESLEYYTAIRQCVPQSDPGVVNYYVWEGDDVKGFVLRTFTLKHTNLGNNAPCTALQISGDPGNLQCIDTALTVVDCGPSGTNKWGEDPTCVEYNFVNGSGAIEKYYRYRPLTIVASQECSPMRNTIDQSIYYVDAELSTTCPASANTCREYQGNAGKNTEELINDDFAETLPSEWGGDIGLSTESLLPFDDHSMEVDGGGFAERTFDPALTKDAAYILKFWAKGSADELKVAFVDRDGEEAVFTDLSPVALSQDSWQEYTLGPIVMNWEWDVSADVLRFTDFGSGQSYIDNIRLTLVTDSFFVNRNSLSNVGVMCPGDEAGCEAYTNNTSGDTEYLDSFSRLCEERVVGCEAVFDSQNNDTPFESVYDTGDYTITTPGDETVRVVNDSDYYCSAKALGCSALGKHEPNRQAADPFTGKFTTTYANVLPDAFDTSVCEKAAEYCAEFSITGESKGGFTWFKDPGNRVCEWVQPLGVTQFGWYYKDATSGEYKECPETTTTIGDPLAPRIPPIIPPREDQPMGGWVGACPAEQSGCIELRDPYSPETAPLYGETVPSEACEARCPYTEDPLGNPIWFNFDETTGVCTQSNDADPEAQYGCQSYFYLSHTLDGSSCTDVDNDKGCRLFLSTEKGAGTYAANMSPDGKNSTEEFGQPRPCGPPDPNDPPITDPKDPSFCDANTLLKVRQDRQCNEWLACKNAIEIDDAEDFDKDGKTKEWQCLEIGKCASFDSNFRCNTFVSEDEDNVVGNRNLPLADVAMSTGYVTAGFQWAGKKCSDNGEVCQSNLDCNVGATCEFDRFFEGLFPYSAMRQYGTGASDGEMAIDGTLENNIITGFPGVCTDSGADDGNPDLFGKVCLSDIECGKDPEDSVVGHCTYNPGAATKSGNDTWHIVGDSDGNTANDGELVIEDELTAGESPQAGGNPSSIDGNNVISFVPASTSPDPESGLSVRLGKPVVGGADYAVTFEAEGSEDDTVLSVYFRFRNNSTQFLGSQAIRGERDNYIIQPVVSSVGDDVVQLEFRTNGKEFKLDNVSVLPVLRVQNPVDNIENSYASRVVSGLTLIKNNDPDTKDSSKALGPEDPNFPDSLLGTFVSIGSRAHLGAGQLTVELQTLATDNVGDCIPGDDETGCDIRVFERGNPDPGGLSEVYDVYASVAESGPYVCIGSGSSNTEGKFDLKGTGLANAKFVQIRDRSCENLPNGITTACDGRRYQMGANCEDGGVGWPGVDIDAVKSLRKNYQYVAQTCRAFAREDSPACNYVDADAVQYQGWKGYCVETDPDNPNSCITWYPLDVVSGDTSALGPRQPAGYFGRQPLYYCAESNGASRDDTYAGDFPDKRKFKFEDQGTTVKIFHNAPYYSYDSATCRLFDNNKGTFFGGEYNWNGSDCELSDVGVRQWAEQNMFTRPKSEELAVLNKSDIKEIYFNIVDYQTQSDYDKEKTFPHVGSRLYMNGEDTGDVPIKDQYNHDTYWRSYEMDLGGGKTRWVLRYYFNRKHPELSYTSDRIQEAINEDVYWNDNYCDGGDDEVTFALIEVDFSATGAVTAFLSRSCHKEGGAGGAIAEVYVVLIEYCKEVVQVTDPIAGNRAWAQRVNEGSSYVVPGYGYQRAGQLTGDDARGSFDTTPFGSVLGLSGEPDAWGSEFITVQSQETTGEKRDQVRAGLPYASGVAGESYASSRACLGGADAGKACLVDADCTVSTNPNAFDVYPNGLCVGINVCDTRDASGNAVACGTGCAGSCIGPDTSKRGGSNNIEANKKLKLLFAKPLGFWQWDGTKFDSSPDLDLEDATKLWVDDYNTMSQCTRARSDDDYCGIPPIVTNVLVNGAIGTGRPVEIENNESVNVGFTVNIDPQQRPMTRYYIDYGDGSDVDPAYSWNALEKSDINNPHQHSHVYHCANPAGCTFTPRIKVIDNWQWCSTKTGVTIRDLLNDGCTDPLGNAWIPFNGSIQILP